jgi:hypothetical protein
MPSERLDDVLRDLEEEKKNDANLAALMMLMGAVPPIPTPPAMAAGEVRTMKAPELAARAQA